MGLVDVSTWLCPPPWWELIVFWPLSSLDISLHVSLAVFLTPAISLWGPGTWQLIWSTAAVLAFCLMISPLSYLLFLTKSVLICSVCHLWFSHSALLSPPSIFNAAYLPPSLRGFNESVRVSYQYADRSPALSAETWYLGHRNNGSSGRWDRGLETRTTVHWFFNSSSWNNRNRKRQPRSGFKIRLCEYLILHQASLFSIIPRTSSISLLIICHD